MYVPRDCSLIMLFRSSEISSSPIGDHWVGCLNLFDNVLGNTRIIVLLYGRDHRTDLLRVMITERGYVALILNAEQSVHHTQWGCSNVYWVFIPTTSV